MKDYSGEQSRLGKTGPDQHRRRKCVPPILNQRGVESDQDGLMTYGTCHTLPPAVRLFSWIPWPPSLCCTESEDSSDSNSEHRHQQQPVFLFPTCFFLVIRCTAHCHQQCDSANLANSASNTSFDRLSRGVMTPSLTPVRPGH